MYVLPIAYCLLSIAHCLLLIAGNMKNTSSKRGSIAILKLCTSPPTHPPQATPPHDLATVALGYSSDGPNSKGPRRDQ